MGRKLRRVAPNWDHPKYTKENAKYENWIGHYRGLYDRSVKAETEEWFAAFDRIRSGGMTSDERKWYPLGLCDWIKAHPFPHPDDYRPDWLPDEMTWFQLYETVSEGTPITPPFATADELVEYLVTHGDFWDQKRLAERSPTYGYDRPGATAGWSRTAAEQIVKDGWAPSFIVSVTPQSTTIKEPRDGALVDADSESSS